jgi:apolipoprotein N-acyltransferase
MRMPFFQRMWKTVDVPIYKETSPTIYTRFGDWFPYVLMALLLAVLIGDMIPKKKRLPLDSSLF